MMWLAKWLLPIGGWMRRAWRWLSGDVTRLVIAALVLALALLVWRLDAANDRAARLDKQVKAERAAHEISLASIASLQASIDAQNADIDRRAAIARQAAQDGAQALARAKTTFAPTQRTVARLVASVGQNEGVCATPPEVKEAFR